MTTLHFRDFLSFDDFVRVQELRLQENDRTLWPEDQDWFRSTVKLEGETIEAAFERFLVALRDAGGLAPAAGSGGRKGSFMSAWNAFVAGEPLGYLDADAVRDQVMKTIAGQMISLPLLHSTRALKEAADPRAGMRAAYDRVCDALTAGKLPWYLGLRDQCAVSGEYLYIVLDGWKATLGKTVRVPGQDTRFEPASDFSMAPIVHREVEFPTGELLAADWFRITEFQDTVDAAGIYRHDPNSAVGRIAETDEYLNDHGFVTVNGGGSPHVLNQDGALVIGRLDEDEAPRGLRTLGRIDTTYRGLTVIDRSRLEAIIAGKVGAEEAREKVDAYLRENREVLRLTVEPGTHHLYFSGGRAFHREFKTDDLSWPQAMKPIFVLSPRPLAYEGQPEPDAPALPQP